MKTLKEARDQGKIEHFIQERKDAPHGDEHALKSVVRSMARDIIYMTKHPRKGNAADDRPAFYDKILGIRFSRQEDCERFENALNELHKTMKSWDNRLIGKR